MSLRAVIAFALVFALFAPVARAQDQPDLWRSFAEKLPPGALVVVRLSNRSTVKGHLVRVTPDTITVLPKTRIAVPARTLAFADVESIDSQKEGMSPGAKVLTGVGAVGGALVAIAIALLASGGLD
jgi:hypothetical protein